MNTAGKTTVIKKRLNDSVNCFEISFFRRNNMLLDILFGPKALLELRKDMMLAISSLLMSCRNIVLPFSIARLSEKFLFK